MRCTYCNEKLASHDLWCINCGRRTEVLSNSLAATKSLNESWKKYKSFKGQNLPVGIWSVLLGILPLILIIWFLYYGLPELPTWQTMLIRNIVWLFFTPVLLVPFRAVCRKADYQITVKEYFASFASYPQYLMLTLLSVIYYLIIYYVCKGDPILRLVWLVLVFYWIAILFPVPILMERYKKNAFSALTISYKKAGDLRWNMFLALIILFIANVLAGIIFLIGLTVILPFTWFAVRDYVDKMIEYEVFDVKEKV
jgi:hypothetical protein